MDLARLQERLDAGCVRHLVPGAQLGLLHRDQRSVLCSGVRSIDAPEPVQPDTAFHAGSLAKSLVGLLVVDAARRGELELDTPCAEQAPGTWPDTPRAILSQVTGRPNLLPNPDEEIGPFVARVAELPLAHEPGRFSYCNPGWPVLDLLLRHCAHGTFEELAGDRILGTHAAFGPPAGSAAGHGVGVDEPVHPVADEVADAASAAGSRWWASAEELLDLAQLNLGDGQGRFAAADVRELRQPYAALPGATMADAWGLGWALWDRGEHHGFGWNGMTGGHRALLRCYPEQSAAVVLLANSAGSLFGGPGGSALFDELLPTALEELGVPALTPPRYGPAHESAELAGAYGPATLSADGPDALQLDGPAFGLSERLRHVRLGGDTFVAEGDPLGAIRLAVDGDLLYIGPFALPRVG
jgi:CubicO group peptidase (beta-lactamase class C family)